MKKKTFILRLFLLIGLLLLTLASTSFADRVLSFPERFQEHSEWCWAGSSEAILKYYGHGPDQCDEANFAWGRSDCCGNFTFEWDHACNQPNYMYGTGGSLQAILTNWGVNSNAVASSLSQNTARSEIDAKRPFVMRFGWTGGGGHFLDPYGMSGNYLYYMDPWPGHGYTISLYSWVVSASDHTWTHTLQLTTNPHGRAEIIGTWNGIWYWNLANSTWTQTYAYVPNGPIAAGDVNGDGKADIVASWTNSGLWWQNGATWGWNKVYDTPPGRLAVADITGDGWAEIIGTWGNGIWYWNVHYPGWTHMYAGVPSGPIAAGDINGDGYADVASIWQSGLWWQNGATLGWNFVYKPSPGKLAVADITGDGKAEIIGTWNGIWYWNPATLGWTQMYSYVPSGPIAAGDVTGDGKADVVSCWASGLWFQKGASLEWKKVYDIAPSKLAVGNITGD